MAIVVVVVSSETSSAVLARRAAPHIRRERKRERERAGESTCQIEREREGQEQRQFPALSSRASRTRDPTCNFLFPRARFSHFLPLSKKLFSSSTSINSMLSSAASSGGAPSRLERLKRWYRSETIDPVKRSCNLVRKREEERERLRKQSITSQSHQKNHSFISFRSLSPHTKPPQSLLRAVALFAGGVIVARNFGDAFNV